MHEIAQHPQRDKRRIAHDALIAVAAKLKRSIPIRIIAAPFAQGALYFRDWRYAHSEWPRRIAELKDSHTGESCFIVGNGPSLSVRDLDALRITSTFSFASNRIYLLFDKTDWRPSLYVAMDKEFLAQDAGVLHDIDSEKKAISWTHSTSRLRSHGDTLLLNCHGHHYTLKKHSGKRVAFSHRPDRVIYDGFTVTFVAMQLALYMGFNRIYLIGMDHTFKRYIDEDGVIHINEGVVDHAYKDPKGAVINPQNRGAIEHAYRLAKEAAEDNGARIYNATRGGSLEVFERVELDEVLKDIEVEKGASITLSKGLDCE